MLSEAKSRFAGKQKIIYTAIIIFVLSVLFVIFRPIQNVTLDKESKTETTYSAGKTKQLYKKGKDSVTTKTKSFHSMSTLKPSAADSSYFFTNSDSSYKLSINIRPATNENLSMEYFLDLTSKDLVWIDTIYQLRVDTLKIKQAITERIDPPFYNTFLFGAVTATLIIILILHLIP